MPRSSDVRRFYDILDRLRDQSGETRRLACCGGRTGWPTHGVYFFFEDGEVRSGSGSGLRVVRVGTHALTDTSRTTLWNRLAQHRGSASTGGGNHRASVFRRLVGEALLRREDAKLGTWGIGTSLGEAARRAASTRAEVRATEHAVEVRVSQHIGAMPLLWVRCDDSPSARGFLERNAIALLSNRLSDPVDPPSAGWLGAHSNHVRVRGSGLWNNNHVDEAYDPSFLDVFQCAVQQMVRAR